MIVPFIILLLLMASVQATLRSNTCISQDAQLEVMETKKASFEPIKNAKWAIVALAKFDKANVKLRNEALPKFCALMPLNTT